MNAHPNHRCTIGLRRQAEVEHREKDTDVSSPTSLDRFLFAIGCIQTPGALVLLWFSAWGDKTGVLSGLHYECATDEVIPTYRAECSDRP